MNRRKFYKNGSLFTIGATLLKPFEGNASTANFDTFKKNKQAKNIIFLVRDGMSMGTLTMSDIFIQRKTVKGAMDGRKRNPY